MEYGYVVSPATSIAGAFAVRIVGYRCQLLDRQGREILAYHWHQAGLSPITFPRVHLSGRLPPLDIGPGIEPVALGDMHLPTGYITLAEIVRLLITEFGVVPRRPDWAAILDAEPQTGPVHW